jgi:hypothetical protein
MAAQYFAHSWLTTLGDVQFSQAHTARGLKLSLNTEGLFHLLTAHSSDSVGRDSIVGIVTCHGLGSLGIESQRGEISHACSNWPWCSPIFLYNVHQVIPRVKWLECGVDHPPHLALRLNKE